MTVGFVRVLFVRVCEPVSVTKLVGKVFVPLVKSLFVRVAVLDAVKTLVGVMMADRTVILYSGCAGHWTFQGNPA